MGRALAGLSLVAAIVTPFDSLPLAQGGQPTFRSRADLVQVDVVVVGRDGAPIRGLKAQDFVLRDRGTPQAIVTFDEMSHERLPPAAPDVLPRGVKRDVGSNQTGQANRLVVMVVDDLHIYRERTDRAKEIARKVLAELGPQSSMAVLFTSGQHSTQVSGDLGVLSAAIETLKGRQSWRRPHPATDAQRGARLDPEMTAEQQLAVIGKTQEAKLQDFFENLTQYKLLQDAARMLGSGDARRKAFVLLSEGIGKDLHGVFDAEITQCETMCSNCPCYHEIALRQAMESMRRSNVATYAIDPRGKVESKDLMLECSPSPPGFMGRDPCSQGLSDFESAVRQAQSGLAIFSEASGGFAVTNTDDFTGGLDRIVSDLDNYYLLGFYPSDPKGKNYRRLDVRVPGHPEWTLRFRHGYMPGGEPPKNSLPMVALSAGVLPKNDVPMRLAATALPGATAGLTRLALALEVTAPVAPLRDPDGRLRDTLKYEVLVVDEKKARVRSMGGLEGKLQLSPSGRPEDMPAAVAYLVETSLEVAPGRYELRVSATSDRLARGGSVYLAVDVPDLRAAPLAIGGIAVTFADGPRAPVAPPSVRRPAPLPFAPTLDRVFTASDTLRVYFEGVSRAPGVSASLTVLDAAGGVARTIAPAVSGGSQVRVEGAVPLSGLAAGPYVLRATLSDGSRTATRDVGFAVR
jgi:VWFA-related protein